MKKLLAAGCLLLAIQVKAQSPVTVTGLIKTPTNTAASFGTATFKLQPFNSSIAYRVAGQVMIGPIQSVCGIDATGHLKSNADLVSACQVWGNDVISPTGTAYEIIESPNNGPGQDFTNALIQGASLDLSNLTFVPNVRVFPDLTSLTLSPLAVSLIPNQDNLYSLGSGGDRFSQAYVNNLFVNNYNTISASSYNGVINAAAESGADIGAQVNAAQSDALCPASGCEIHIPAGTGNYNFSTQISFSKTILLVCDGIGGMANGGNRQNTTLTWTGGASAAILISGSSATASKIKGCALNNTGTGTVGIDLDSGANDVQLEDVPIVLPTVPFSVAAFRVGNTGIVVNPQFKHTVARAAAPIGYDILNVQSHFVGIELRANSSTVADVVLGKASASVQSFDCYGCIFETASGVNSVVFQRVEGAHFYGGYDEAGGVATVYPFDIPTTTTLARNISFDGMFFSCVRATCANAPVHSNFGSAMVDIQNSYVVGYGTNSLFQNDSVQRAHITGNDIFSNGAVASSFTNVDQCGNGVNSVIVACSFTGISSAGPIGTGTPSTGAFTTLSASGQVTSTLSTGTAPLVIASTTPVANLTLSQHPQVEYCGATSGGTQACTKTVLSTPFIVQGDVLLNTATTQSITTLPFTNANYSCFGSDLTTAAGIVSFNTYANASVTIQESGGANTDHLRYQCVGN